MTSLDDFLNKKEFKQPTIKNFETVDGSFSCQNSDCNIVTSEAFLDRSNNRVKWTCSNGHDSSVIL